MITPDGLQQTRRALGQQLAKLRKAADLTQHQLADSVYASRSSIAGIETGRQNADRDFWTRADHLTHADGALLAAYDHLRDLQARHARRSTESRRPGTVTLASPKSARSAHQTATSSAAVDALVDALMNSPNNLPPLTQPAEPHSTLAARVASTKTAYQACHYNEAIRQLPDLLRLLTAAESQATEAELVQVRTNMADAYHVLGSILLKHGDRAMALLAAERSTRYAAASGDPVTVASSARIMTHALMSASHSRQAVRLAQEAASRLDGETRVATNDELSVYGALSLRGAVAAARSNDRDAAHTLLDEASRAATNLGRDDNHRWTGFGPTNVLLHRVSVSLALGDAGTAINYARQVDLGKVQLVERRACLYIDVAQAYTNWGRYEQALSALHTAATVAPQEVRTKETVRRIISHLTSLAPGPTGADAADFAANTGIADVER